MRKTPSLESVPDMPTKLKDKLVRVLFSCLLFFVVSVLAAFLFLHVFFHVFFASLAPKQEDIDHTTEGIKYVEAMMRDFEQSLPPILERIEKLEERFPARETTEHVE